MQIITKNDYAVSHNVAGVLTGEWLTVDACLAYAFICVWTGTPSGTLTLQVSNDQVNTVNLDTQAMGGVAGSKLFNQSLFGYKHARVIASAGGAGSLSIQASAK